MTDNIYDPDKATPEAWQELANKQMRGKGVDSLTWHTAEGDMLSSTVTVAVQLLLLPAPSVTVRVTVFAPMFVQSKLLLSKLILDMPQLSLLPLSISAASPSNGQ